MDVGSTGPGPGGRLLLPALFCLGALGLAPAVRAAPSPAQAEQPAERGADELAQHLLDARASGEPKEALSARLAAGGPRVLPELFELLSRGRFDVRVGERGNSTKSLTLLEREAVAGAFGRTSWQAARAFLEARVAEHGGAPAERERSAALDVLRLHGGAGDLPLLLAWCGPYEDGVRVPRAVCSAFARALGGILDREPAAARAIPDLYRAAHVSLLPSLWTALGARPSEPGLEALVAVLGEVPEADALLLTEIGHVARSLRLPVDGGVCARVRARLKPGAESTLLAQAVAAAGALEDLEAVPTLIGLLGHRDSNVASLAQDALAEITGQRLPRDAEEWSAWHAKVGEWWRTRAGEELELVRSGPAPRASRALLELAKRRSHRHELVEPLRHGLDRDEEELVLLTCATLGHLGSTRAVRLLLERLDDPSVEVRKAAFLALRRITGEDHGEDSADWVEAGW